MIRAAAILREADHAEAVPAEQPPHDSRPDPQRLNPMDRHDDIGARQQAAPPPQPLVGPLQPEIPFAQGRAHQPGDEPQQQQGGDSERACDDLTDHAQSQQPSSGPGQEALPFAPFPDVEIEQEIELLRSARNHRDHGEGEFEQAEGQHAFRPHGEEDGRFARHIA